ncbi:MAG: sigma-54-dependent Fis family transcriptional regulator [Rubripirellula sp.]|nr:sigma-54-dependent Fis family transcriptional regulator [Rubripirellula sp.]
MPHYAHDDSESLEVRLAVELINSLRADSTRSEFLAATLPDLVRTLGGNTGGIVHQQQGRWHRDFWTGDESVSMPEALIGESLDQAKLLLAEGWCATPMLMEAHGGSSATTEAVATALILRLPIDEQDAWQRDEQRRENLQSIADLLAAALQRIDSQDQRIRRIHQLNTVLEAAAEWQTLDDDEALLKRIADTATELLNCERASIFLWDRRRKKLIGRPALGVEGGVLEVDDNVGVVGEVLRTGEAKIWNGGADDESRVNRKVDRSLEFETRSLVAVPMQGQRDTLIGVFEAINHRGEGFDAFDAVLLADLATHAAVAIASQRTRRKLTETRDRLVNDAASAAPLIGENSAIDSVRQNATKVAGTDLSVLILGENGTGKEVLARHIHFESERRSGPFIAVNCAALVESLLESELFGHEKGAFTDANATHVGKFELASGGTLFLDEVGDMSPGGQAKLLRVLEDKIVVRVGGSQSIPVDVRVVAATNQPLEDLIEQKRFREDLYFRLNVVKLTLPPLSQRGDDVLLLTNQFLHDFCYQIGRKIPTLDRGAQGALLAHHWPGNVRELRNTIERICYLCDEDVIHAADLMLSGSKLRANSKSATIGTLKDATRDFQVEHINAAIEACHGNMTDAAARLGLHRSNLYRKMRQLGVATSGEED